MKKKQIALICSLSALFIIGTFLGFLISTKYSTINDIYSLNAQPSSSEDTCQSLIDSIFAQKQTEHSMVGYYPQIYEPSLQATYYGLSILDMLGQLNLIDPSEITSYIMSFYDKNSHLFYDDYIFRYLDMTNYYYPLSSFLEINCYAPGLRPER